MMSYTPCLNRCLKVVDVVAFTSGVVIACKLSVDLSLSDIAFLAVVSFGVFFFSFGGFLFGLVLFLLLSMQSSSSLRALNCV